MITGAHAIIYSSAADADRAFLRDGLGFPSVDVGGGWLIFALPPAEVAVHPLDQNDLHQLYLMCDDVGTFVASMAERGVICTPPADQGWGVLTRLTLPGGGTIGVYEPRHPRPPARPPRSRRQDKGGPGTPRNGAARKTTRLAARRSATKKSRTRRR